MKNILIINGPNLNLLAKREPEIYGNVSFEDFLIELRQEFPNIEISYYQTNHEGAIIDKLQAAADTFEAVILNAAAYTHTSIAISDTLKMLNIPIVEVHISNINQREEYRKFSYVSNHAALIIMGEGLAGYAKAVSFLANL